jgi:hypothetical protein
MSPRDFVAQLGIDLQNESCPPEVHPLGRTLRRLLTHITAWHEAKVTYGPTEAINNLIKRIGFAFRRLCHYRIPGTALRRATQLGTTRHDHTPLNPKSPSLATKAA